MAGVVAVDGDGVDGCHWTRVVAEGGCEWVAVIIVVDDVDAGGGVGKEVVVTPTDCFDVLG